MKKLILLSVLFSFSGAVLPIHAQQEAVETVILNVDANATAEGKSVEQTLAELKAANILLLQKQKATLERLEHLEKQADQLRIFSKRS